MKYSSVSLLLVTACALCSCGDNASKNIISVRHIHKYGYDVPKDEWTKERYPGQKIVTLKDGTTITSSYEDGELHGTKTQTFAHSQTVETLEQYSRGRLIKRITYSIRGVPQKEEVFKDAHNVCVTTWYPKGTPQMKEEYQDETLISGKYFNLANDMDSYIEEGHGEKTIRNPSGDILSKEIYKNHEITYVENYYPNNSPHTAISYEDGLMHGECKEYAITGEPLSIENYHKGKKQGLCTYYQNGCKYLETNYHNGYKKGVEREYIDGHTLVAETEYAYGKKHGISTVYCDGCARTYWYFDGMSITQQKYNQMLQRQDFIMGMQR